MGEAAHECEGTAGAQSPNLISIFPVPCASSEADRDVVVNKSPAVADCVSSQVLRALEAEKALFNKKR
jgi:hypothetical protein